MKCGGSRGASKSSRPRLECFSENGFHQTGMADIVRRSGMSHGAVYVHFESKDDIIEALADDRHQSEAELNSVVESARRSDRRRFMRWSGPMRAG